MMRNVAIDINISTQVVFPGSRPDMVIETSDAQGYDVIFVEFKIGSEEGPDQLTRYAQILASEFPHARRRILAYITKNFDPKDLQQFLDVASPERVEFVQIRWQQFYSIVKESQKTDPTNEVIAEMVLFMEELGMGYDHQFSPLDIVTLANLQRGRGPDETNPSRRGPSPI